jgi:Na+-transporting NADH:ubiquinone oxidoreductase subunit NqrF
MKLNLTICFPLPSDNMQAAQSFLHRVQYTTSNQSLNMWRQCFTMSVQALWGRGCVRLCRDLGVESAARV